MKQSLSEMILGGTVPHDLQVLVPQPDIVPRPWLKAPTPNHWTIRVGTSWDYPTFFNQGNETVLRIRCSWCILGILDFLLFFPVEIVVEKFCEKQHHLNGIS